MGKLLQFSNPNNSNSDSIFESDLKELARLNNFDWGITKMYGYAMRDYIRAGSPMGASTNGFLRWYSLKKKHTK